VNSPFDELSKSQIKKLFELLEVHIYKFNKNQEVLPTIKNENIIGIILDGSAQIINIEYNGNETISEELSKDSVFGTSISGTNSEDCQIIAKQPTEVLVIDYNIKFQIQLKRFMIKKVLKVVIMLKSKILITNLKKKMRELRY